MTNQYYQNATKLNVRNKQEYNDYAAPSSSAFLPLRAETYCKMQHIIVSKAVLSAFLKKRAKNGACAPPY